jgi:hypothetical protein
MDRRTAEETIGRAAQIDMERSEEMRVEDVIEAARGVDISEKSVRAALEEKENAVREKASRRAAVLNTLVRSVPAILAINAVLVIAALCWFGLASSRMTLVEQKRADVASALHRQNSTIAIWSGAFDVDRVRSRDAELMGSENRVRIAMHRYDVAATRYNRIWFVQRLPLSNEVTRW